MKIKGAIFDMDGTLVDSLFFWDYLWREIGIKYMNDESFKPTEEIDKHVRTCIYTDAMTAFKEYYNIPGETADFLDFAIGALSGFYEKVVRPKEGAFELLDYLKDGGIKICLASATASAQIKISLKSRGLEKYFDTVLSCADLGSDKTKPDIYLEAMKQLGENADDICVFEDSCVALETAKRVGFKTIGIFDKYNFGQDRLKAASDFYLEEGISLAKLIDEVEI